MAITVDEMLLHIKQQIDSLRTVRNGVKRYESFNDSKECKRLELLHEEIEGLNKILLNKEPYYYKIGTPVLVYWESKWQNGRIISGYRTRDGVVHVQLNDGQTISFGEARHEEYIKLV